jgi:hypothetical protein
MLTVNGDIPLLPLYVFIAWTRTTLSLLNILQNDSALRVRLTDTVRRPRFDPGSVHVGFVVDKVALGQDFP